MNVNPFGSSSIHTNSTPSTMNANQSCVLRFGASSDDYDDYQSSVPKKKESFWQKWKNVIIGTFATVGIGILGIVGYNKGWFSKAKNVATSSSPQTKPNDLNAALQTLGLSDGTIKGGTKIADLLKKTNNVTTDQFSDVVKAVKTVLETAKDSSKAAAAVTILEQLRKNLANKNGKIGNFNPNSKIDNINVLDEILKEEKPVEEVKPAEEVKEEKPVEEVKPAEANPAEEVTEVNPVEAKPAEEVKEEKPVEKVKPVEEVKEEKPVENENPVEEVNPAEANPTEEVKPEEKTEEAKEEEEKKNFNQKLTNLKSQLYNLSIKSVKATDIDELFKYPNLIDSNNAGELAKVLNTAIENNMFNNEQDKIKIQQHLDTLFAVKIDSTNVEQLAKVLNTAIENNMFNNKQDKINLQQYLGTLFAEDNFPKTDDDNDQDCYYSSVINSYTLYYIAPVLVNAICKVGLEKASVEKFISKLFNADNPKFLKKLHFPYIAGGIAERLANMIQYDKENININLNEDEAFKFMVTSLLNSAFKTHSLKEYSGVSITKLLITCLNIIDKKDVLNYIDQLSDFINKYKQNGDLLAIAIVSTIAGNIIEDEQKLQKYQDKVIQLTTIKTKKYYYINSQIASIITNYIETEPNSLKNNQAFKSLITSYIENCFKQNTNQPDNDNWINTLSEVLSAVISAEEHLGFEDNILIKYVNTFFKSVNRKNTSNVGYIANILTAVVNTEDNFGLEKSTFKNYITSFLTTVNTNDLIRDWNVDGIVDLLETVCAEDKNILEPSVELYETINSLKDQLLKTNSKLDLKNVCKRILEINNQKTIHVGERNQKLNTR